MKADVKRALTNPKHKQFKELDVKSLCAIVVTCTLAATLVVVAGGICFYAIEHGYEEELLEERRQLNGKIQGYYQQWGASEEQIADIEEFFLTGDPNDEGANINQWDFSGAAKFVLTVITTQGPGWFTPNTDLGRLFTVIYGFPGILIYGLLMLVLCKSLIALLRKALLHLGCIQTRMEKIRRFPGGFTGMVSGLIFFFWLFLAPFFTMAGEGWGYITSFYYNFSCLATIGFGDIKLSHEEPWTIICFNALGIGFTVTFITSLMQTGAEQSNRPGEFMALNQVSSSDTSELVSYGSNDVKEEQTNT